MADDRIDEAIAAVVRAVDRIEAATRGVSEDPPVLPDPSRLPRKPPPPAFTATDLRGAGGFAARPTTSLGQPQPPVEQPPVEESVDPLEFDEPEALAPEFDAHEDAPSHDLWHEETFYEPEPAFEAPVPAYEPSAPPAAAPPAAPPLEPPATVPVPSYDALAPTGDDEVHELVGRIIARTQHLEDQLELARQLRFEITELVRRLAAAVERDK